MEIITWTHSLVALKVAKDVSIRLHSQLDSVEKKRSGLEQENEELRVRLQDLEVARQVLQQEIDKVGRPRGEAELGGSLTTGPLPHYHPFLSILALLEGLRKFWPRSRLSFSFSSAHSPSTGPPLLRSGLDFTPATPLALQGRSLLCQVWPIKKLDERKERNICQPRWTQAKHSQRSFQSKYARFNYKKSRLWVRHVWHPQNRYKVLTRCQRIVAPPQPPFAYHLLCSASGGFMAVALAQGPGSPDLLSGFWRLDG